MLVPLYFCLFLFSLVVLRVKLKPQLSVDKTVCLVTWQEFELWVYGRFGTWRDGQTVDPAFVPVLNMVHMLSLFSCRKSSITSSMRTFWECALENRRYKTLASFNFTYWAPEVCRQDLLALHVIFESPSGLLQCGFVSCLPQFPQNQTSQQGIQVTCQTNQTIQLLSFFSQSRLTSPRCLDKLKFSIT